MSKFKSVLTKTGKELGAFFTSPIVLKNLGGMLGTILVILLSTFFLMKKCTRHGEKLEVEDFTGLHVRDAIAKARALDFKIVVSDSIDRGTEANKPNTVRSQNPIPFSKVKKNRTIYLTIYKYGRDEVPLPRLTGNDEYDRYARMCNSRGIETKIRQKILNQKYAPNTILRIYYEDREIDLERVNRREYKLPKGSVVEMDVTQADDGYTKMPDIACLQFEQAKSLIESYELVLGTIKEDPTVINRATAFVYQQSPEYNPTQKIRKGQQIALYLTQDRPQDCKIGN